MSTIARRDGLDCSRPAAAAFWFIVGGVLALALMNSYSAGRWSSLLNVGSANPLLGTIESELGSVFTADAVGHDGQLYYLIARDPLGTRGTPQLLLQYDNGPRYRYRRILFPLLAGAFGTLRGHATLAGMVFWLAAAMGLVTAATADLCFQLNVRGPWVLLTMANTGAMVSLLILTADALALALALIGLSLILRSRTGWAVAAFAAAALTKELYLLVPLTLAALAWRTRGCREAFTLAVLSALPVAIWSVWIVMSLPAAGTAAENIGLPLIGIVHAARVWILYERNYGELLLLGFVATSFVTATAMVVLGRNPVLRWLVVPWLILGSVSTQVVWGRPNNPARVFSILWPLSMLLLGEAISGHRTRAAERRAGI
jgi:hypothetical protein